MINKFLLLRSKMLKVKFKFLILNIKILISKLQLYYY